MSGGTSRRGLRAAFAQICLIIVLTTPDSSARAQDSLDAPSADLHRKLAANTEVHLRLLEQIASNTHRRGDTFTLEVAEPVLIDGAVLIPAGAPAVGEVVHADKPGMAGKGGELILTVRRVRIGDREVKLRSFTAGVGQNRFGLAQGLGVTVGIPALFVVGKNIIVPAGTDVFAKIASDTWLPLTSASSESITATEFPIDTNKETQDEEAQP